jgi:hypothetical protein
MTRNTLFRFSLSLLATGLTLGPTQLAPAQEAAPTNPEELAITRLRTDVPKFTDWEVQPVALPEASLRLLGPFKVVQLALKQSAAAAKPGTPVLKALVAVAPDGKTYRFTNDTDLAAIIDQSGLKALFATDANAFAQTLAALRTFPDEARVIGHAKDIPVPPGEPDVAEAAKRFESAIAPLETAAQDNGTKLTFHFWNALGGAISKMVVTVAEPQPTSVRTIFVGYTSFAMPR